MFFFPSFFFSNSFLAWQCNAFCKILRQIFSQFSHRKRKIKEIFFFFSYVMCMRNEKEKSFFSSSCYIFKASSRVEKINLFSQFSADLWNFNIKKNKGKIFNLNFPTEEKEKERKRDSVARKEWNISFKLVTCEIKFQVYSTSIDSQIDCSLQLSVKFDINSSRQTLAIGKKFIFFQFAKVMRKKVIFI